MQPNVAAVVLATGSSSSGNAGTRALLEEMDGRPVVAAATRAALEARCSPVVVVTGHDAPEVEAVLPAAATVERNPRWAEGTSSSLRHGMAALPRATDAAFVASGWMPRVRASHYRTLLHRWRPGSIVLPTRRGLRGRPILWSGTYFAVLAGMRGDEGCEALLRRFADRIREVSIGDDGVLFTRDDPDGIRYAEGAS